MVFQIEPYAFLHLGRSIMKMHCKLADATEKARFHASFGTSPEVCSVLWEMLDPREEIDRYALPQHLLWALMFLKLYCSERVNRMIVGVDEDTFRKWAWLFVEAISYLEDSVVSFESVCLIVIKHSQPEHPLDFMGEPWRRYGQRLDRWDRLRNIRAKTLLEWLVQPQVPWARDTLRDWDINFEG
jgi:hypothetical protein